MDPISCLEIGFAARLFSDKRQASEEIDFAKANGFASIQFRRQEQEIDKNYLGGDLATIAALLDQKGLRPTLELLIGIDEKGQTPSGNTPTQILEANLAAIETLSISFVHWHLYPYNYLDLNEDSVLPFEAPLIPHLAAAVSLANENGFTFGFENNAPEALLFARPPNCLTLLKQVPGLNFVWDLNHTLPADVAAFQSLAKRMSMLHISDTPLPQTNHHLPLGMGTIDFSAYLSPLQAQGFKGPAIFEIGGLPKSGGFGRDTDQALVDSRKRLETLLHP